MEIEPIETAPPKKKNIPMINLDTGGKECSINLTASKLLERGTTNTFSGSPGLRPRPETLGLTKGLSLVPCGESPRLKRSQSIKDPSDRLTERSKIYNSCFGLFFATGAFGFGYNWAVMSPLGEKWIRFHFEIIDDASLYLGFTNLAWALGALIGSP